MEIRSRLRLENMPEDATLPSPRVVLHTTRTRVTLRYDPEDWRGYFVIEERRADALGIEAWVPVDPEIFPTRQEKGPN